jgi:hypothetical protein
MLLERGICENINGLLRQYLPKATDPSLFSQRQLDDIARKLKAYPEKHSAGKLRLKCFSQKAPSTSSRTGLTSAILPLRMPFTQRGIEKWKVNRAFHFSTAPTAELL